MKWILPLEKARHAPGVLMAVFGLTKLCQALRKKRVERKTGLADAAGVTGASAPPTKSTKQIIR
jgi:hypothetical protein